MTLTFRIQIRGIKKPLVWRRIEIPANFTFFDFHMTIQNAFGWFDEHLFSFSRMPYDGGWQVAFPTEMDFVRPKHPATTKVIDLLEQFKLLKFVYTYDFGDDWIHDITFEGADREKELVHPVCLAGKGACPPEDCGGPWGYESLKERLADQEEGERDDDDADFEDIDPTYFDLEEVNAELEEVSHTPAKQAKEYYADRY